MSDLIADTRRYIYERGSIVGEIILEKPVEPTRDITVIKQKAPPARKKTKSPSKSRAKTQKTKKNTKTKTKKARKDELADNADRSQMLSVLPLAESEENGFILPYKDNERKIYISESLTGFKVEVELSFSLFLFILFKTLKRSVDLEWRSINSEDCEELVEMATCISNNTACSFMVYLF